MRGISDVIAMLLMLVITIGLVGVAYSYITGVFTARTSVTLSIDSQNSYCNSTHLVVAVRNDGTNPSGAVTVVAYNVTGASSSCNIPSPPGIGPGAFNTCSIQKGATTISGAGYYRITASTAGSTASGIIYCPS
jgi:FlaG/FlaF family flagellin (archaellin)